jgi:crossover junction endodeoxyribonuclease RusA
MIEIVLGWPPSDLSPNARLHWAKLARAKKQYRQACLSVTKEQLKNEKNKKNSKNIPERLVLEMTFIPPDRRSYDRDNLVARMKSGIDGLSDALRINDKRFNTVISTMDQDYLGGFVKIRILKETPYGTKSERSSSKDEGIYRQRRES